MICACYRHTNKVAVIHPYQLYGVWLEGFHSWQCVFCLYLCSFVPDGTEKIVLKYIIFYLVIAAIQQLCVYLPQAIETILSIFTLFIRVMIPVVLFASTFIATTKVSELIAAMYSLKIPRSITITFAMVLRFFQHSAKKFTIFMMR